MNIAVNTLGRAASIIDKTNFSPRIQPGTDTIFHDTAFPQVELSTSYRHLNASVETQNLYGYPELAAQLFSGVISKGQVVSWLSSFWNGRQWAPWIEFSFSPFFMPADIGVAVECSHGCGGLVHYSVLQESIKGFNSLEQLIHSLQYRGQVVLGVTEKYELAACHFGFFPAFFAAFQELQKSTVLDLIGFLVGVHPKLKTPLVGHFAVLCLVSAPPYPYALQGSRLQLPHGAEKHAYRVYENGHEIYYLTAHSESIFEARRRVRRSLNGISNHNPVVQYRIDFGQRLRFLFLNEAYLRASARVEIGEKPQAPDLSVPATCP